MSNTIKAIIIFAGFLVICACDYVSADDLLLGQYTHHASKFYESPCYDLKKEDCQFDEINDDHPLIGINANGYTAFVMKNSFNRVSVGFLKTYDYEYKSNIRTFLSAGVVSGYKDALPVEWHGIAPAIYAGLDLHPSSDKWGIIVTYAPQQFVGIGLRFNIGDVL